MYDRDGYVHHIHAAICVDGRSSVGATCPVPGIGNRRLDIGPSGGAVGLIVLAATNVNMTDVLCTALILGPSVESRAENVRLHISVGLGLDCRSVFRGMEHYCGLRKGLARIG